MSLNGILQNALSGLNTNQAALRATSTNIANVNTPGYTRRLIEQQSLVVGTEGGGVTLADSRRAIDTFALKDLRVRAAEAERFKAQADYQDRLQVVVGKPQDSFSMSGRLTQLLSDLSTLSITPESAVTRRTALDSIDAWGEELNRVANQVQELRSDADRRIAALTKSVNGLLSSISTLNPQIVNVKAQGGDTSALEEARDQAVQKLSSLVDVQVATQSDGSYHILTQSGTVLLDTALRQLNYNSNGGAAPGNSFPQIAIDRIDSASGTAITTGIVLDPGLRGGELKGLLDIRNVQLPQVATQLGELASSVIDQLNRAHNANSAVPAPTSLTGRSTGALGTDTNNFTGLATFAVLDANNNVVSSTTVNFGTLGGTLAGVVSAVNTGLGGAGTLSLTNGVMSFSAAAGNRVVIAQDATNPSNLGGHGFSDFFGMNDLVAARAPAHFDTGLTSASAQGFGSGTVSLRLVGPGGEQVGAYSLNLASAGATVGGVISTLNTGMNGFASFALDANGALQTTINTNYNGYTLEVVNDTSERGGAGTTGISFSRLFGLGDTYRQNAAFDIAVKPSITADPSLFALAKLSPGSTPALTVGDNRGALALSQIDAQQLGFAAAGDLPATTASLTGYTAQVLGSIANAAATIDGLAKDTAAVRAAIEAKRDEFSSVNIDEELANMIVFQQAYNAAARLITTANELYDILLSITE
jgi:flagellar hook-associated protein 1